MGYSHLDALVPYGKEVTLRVPPQKCKERASAKNVARLERVFLCPKVARAAMRLGFFYKDAPIA